MRTSFCITVRLVVLTCTLSLVSMPGVAVADTYTFTTIDNPLGVNGTQLHGISSNNIVGNYYDATNGPHGFLYNGSTYTTIDHPSAALGTTIGGISGNNIVGSYRDASNIAHGFIYNISTSNYTTFDHPLTVDLTAGCGISGTNIVGYFGYGHQGGPIGATGYNGFLYNGATFTTIDHPLGVNGTFCFGIDANNIVGSWGDATGHNHGFLYDGLIFTTIDDPLGANGTIINGISGNTIVGFYTDASGIGHGFLYSISTSNYTTFDDPLGVNSKGANGISGNNIVGSFWDELGNSHGYLATPNEPHILRQPRGQVGYWGKSTTFYVTAYGAQPLSYQWSKDGTPIVGATDNSLVLTNLQMTDAGAYSVLVTNIYGSVTSNPAFLTMNPAGVSLALYAGVTIDGVVGLTYGIQYTTDLSNTNNWQGLANITLSVPTMLWFDLQPANRPQRYYRVVPGPISIP